MKTAGTSLLLVAGFIISHLPMNKQGGKVDGVEIWNDAVESSWKRPSQGHQPIATGEGVQLAIPR